MRVRFLVWSLVLVLAVPARASDKPHFVRTRAGRAPEPSAFQTAAIRYHKASSPVDVVLCAVVHLGERGYYGRIQKMLARSERVLYEAVQVGEGDHPVPAGDRWADPAQMLGNLLGLVHQATAIDYARKNFVWADVSLHELLNKGGEDLLEGLASGGPTAAAGALAGGIASMLMSMMDPRRARAELAKVLCATFDDLPAILGDQFSRPLIALRNKKLLTVFDRELAHLDRGTLTILYGAGHMPDLDRTLQSRGYQPVETRWLSAWTY